MRQIVACGECGRQYDVAGRPTQSQLRCHCGAVLTVEAPQGHDASVVRCASCGGARHEGDLLCRYCAASFTIHEHDLHTICPTCLARISDRASFCHHCATPISPERVSPTTTSKPCPVCGDEAPLGHRMLGEAALPILECSRCAGIWMSRASFLALEQEAAAAGRVQGLRVSPGKVARPPSPVAGTGPIYRKCPECQTLMNRQNYGKMSGIIVDQCKEHGLWFDAHELDAVLRWVREGGLEVSAAREAQKREEELKRLLREKDAAAPGLGFTSRTHALNEHYRQQRQGQQDLGAVLFDFAWSALRTLFR